MNPLQDIFISYGRADSYHFAKKLNDCLVSEGLTVWFDFDDIPLGVDYQKQINDGIDKADNFLFIISPHSVNSPYCALELERALQQGKRIIPLLHVEEISYATWLRRNPQGTERQWLVYKAMGKHSCFPNMHSAIQSINWVYFREGPQGNGSEQSGDDFGRSLQGVLDICQRQRDYVRDHTIFLNRALEWSEHQKETQHLLAGAQIQQALEWLQVRFKESQPPCLPTDLHAEYITESLKNAQNLHTQVFLGYADSDVQGMEIIRCFLQRQGLTVWSAHSDIFTGENCAAAIKGGIENADNVVLMLSPDFLASDDTQAQLAYALELNKRIIPIWMCSLAQSKNAKSGNNLPCLSPSHLPPELTLLQAVDLRRQSNPEDWSLKTSDLLKQIRHDAPYVETHKILLTLALKWQRQHQNPCILLRGHTLHHAEAWLKTAEMRDRRPPTALQRQFIQASLQQPPIQALDVFLSYSRSDADVARKLNDALQKQGKRTWFDQESIAPGADFQQEIYQGIEASDNIVFVLSPSSINSPYCVDEVDYAASLNKRFVTVLCREIDVSTLHPTLAQVQWIDFSQPNTDFSDCFIQLMRTLDTDRAYVQSHTKYSQQAIAWDNQRRSQDLLLRGAELAIAEHWHRQSIEEQKQPLLTEIQKQFIAASREQADAEESREQKRFSIMQRQFKATMVASIFAIGGLVAIGASGWLSFRHGQKAVTSLAAELNHQISEQIQQNMETDMERRFSFSRSVAIAAKNGSLDITNLDSLRNYIWGYFQLSDGEVSKIYVGTEAGEFVFLSTDGDQVIMSVVNEETDFQRLTYDVDALGNFTTLRSVASYDPRVRTWYTGALQGLTASPVYPFKSTGELGISLSEMVKDSAGVLQGVASVDLSLSTLQTVLENLKLETHSHIYILEPSGTLLASTSNMPLVDNKDDTLVRANALESESVIINQATQQLINSFQSLDHMQSPQTMLIDVDDDKLIAWVDTLGEELGLNWVIVTLIPQSEVMKEINTNARITAILFCSSIVMACILGVYVYKTIQLSSNFEKANQKQLAMRIMTRITSITGLRQRTSMTK